MNHPKILTTCEAVLCANSEDIFTFFTFAIPKQTKVILKSDYDRFVADLIEKLENINKHYWDNNITSTDFMVISDLLEDLKKT